MFVGGMDPYQYLADRLGLTREDAKKKAYETMCGMGSREDREKVQTILWEIREESK